MRLRHLLPLLMLLSSCSLSADETCEQTPGEVSMHVSDRADDYSDLVALVRNDRFDELVRTAPNYNGLVFTSNDKNPKVCEKRLLFPQSVSISYPPRANQHVGAVLDLYFDENGDVKVAEFYVVPKMP